MAVRVGKIELVGLNKVYTEDTRNLVKLRGPGQIGGVYQDLGREPVSVVMEGILVGDDTQSALEELREAQAKAKPMSFAADAVAGADLTQVLIADFQVRQLAGFKERFAFFLRVREYTEPPEPEGAGAAKVQEEAAADAEKWQKGAVDAAAVEQDPSLLADKIEENPDLVAHMSGDKLGEIVGKNPDITGEKFGSVLGAVGKANPSALPGLVSSLKSQGKLGALIQKLADGGVKILNFVKKIKIGAILDLYKMIANGADFLKKLKAVGSAAKSVIETIPKVNLEVVFDVDSVATDVGLGGLIDSIRGLVAAVKDLLKSATFESLISFVKNINLQGPLSTGLKVIRDALETVVAWSNRLAAIAAMPRAFEPLGDMLAEFAESTDMTQGANRAELESLHLHEFIEASKTTHNVVIALHWIHTRALDVVAKVLPEKPANDLAKELGELKETIGGYYDKVTNPKTAEEGST